MNITRTSFSAIGLLLLSGTLAHAECSPSLMSQLVHAQRIIDSLRPDKAGQMRTYAIDGSEYTAGQALWLKAQLRATVRACAEGNEASAAARLRDVVSLLEAHHRVS
jgi:hypothetical protein